VYEAHWSLQLPPFEAAPDSRFLFPTAQHEHALAALQYAACDSGEPVLLCGSPGCGKTLLLRALRRRLPQQQYHVAFIPDLTCMQGDLLRRAAHHLTQTPVADAGAAMDVIAVHLEECARRGVSVVLMLDDWPVDAQRQALDELRWLLNPDSDSARVCVLLALDVTKQPEWPSWFSQRLLACPRLEPLAGSEVAPYLSHRLRAAGHADGEVFSAPAAALLAEWSRGIPRLINRAAHLALHVAALQAVKRVDEDAARQALHRLVQFHDRPTASGELAGAQV